MKPASAKDAQAVLEAVAAGDPVPAGYAFDGSTVYALEAADEERIDDGGTVAPPDEPAGPATTTTTTTTKAPAP
jgi:hypothetical protein